jgi:predicted DNA-binding transcriptional regulator YafY
MPTASQRLLSLLSLLQKPRVWTGSELAERLAVSPRTIRRDIDKLRELGYPVDAIMGGEGGYRLVPGAAMPPLALDDDEAVAVAIGLRLAVTRPLNTDEDAAVRALAKLVRVLPARLRRRVDNVASMIAAHPFAALAAPVDPDALVTLAAAIANHERIRFSYTRPGYPTENRYAEPFALIAATRSWQLLAFDLDRDDWRTFRLDRASHFATTRAPSRTREIPGGDAAAFIAARTLRATPIYRAYVVIRASTKEAVTRLGEAAGQDLTELPDGTCRWVSPPDSLDWLTFRLTSLGLPFEVHGPPELIAHVHAVGLALTAATTADAAGNT